MKILVIGAGKVGLPLAYHFATTHGIIHDVVIYDTSATVRDKIHHRENPYSWEPGIDLKAVRVGVLNDLRDVHRFSPDAVFVVVPTEQVGDTLACGAVHEVLGALDAGLTREHTPVAIVSTLDPRTAAAICVERRQMTVVYNPVMIRLGNVLEDLQNATMLLIGRVDTPRAIAAGNTVASCYFAPNAKTIVGDVTSIACAKLAINATLSMRVAWANDVAAQVETFGGDVDKVFEAIAAEPRIGGTSYMSPGLPPGGPCLPRDLDVWASGSRALVGAVVKAHAGSLRAHSRFVLDWIGKNRPKKSSPCIAVVGLAYKKGGPDKTAAFGTALLETLREFNGVVSAVGYDAVLAPSGLDGAQVNMAVFCHDYPEIEARFSRDAIPILKLGF